MQKLEIYPSFDVGEIVSPTVDIRTDAGYAVLIHADYQKLKEDYAVILSRQKDMLVVERKK